MRSLKRLLRQLLLVDGIRYYVAWARFHYFRIFGGGIRTLDATREGTVDNTIRHNLLGLKDLAVTRSLALIRPVSVIESVDTAQAKVLTVGPRTEGEILSLVGHGFAIANITGLDLISYSPWITLGDMHEMPFDTDSFDVVLLPWVIAYSDDQGKVADEVTRVCKPGGVVGIGVEYNPESTEDIKARLGYKPGSERRMQHAQEILDLFDGHVGEVLFLHDVCEERRGVKGALCAIFSVKK